MLCKFFSNVSGHCYQDMAYDKSLNAWFHRTNWQSDIKCKFMNYILPTVD